MNPISMTDKEIWGSLSLVATIAGCIPYVAAIIEGRCRPHVFSWMIWTCSASLMFVAQLSRDAGAGAWVTGLTAVACLVIATLACRCGEKDITRGDEILFGLALAAIPLWAIEKDPLYSVILLVVIGVLGFMPTFRKSYDYPHEELVFFYVTCALKFVFGLMAIEEYSLTTMLYPIYGIAMNGALVLMLLWRRASLAGAINVVGSSPAPLKLSVVPTK